jgi:multidrug efflux pump subunit AcrB
MAVIFEMLASYFLSRTVVPTVVHFLLRGQPILHDAGPGEPSPRGDIFWRIHVRFNRHFERFRTRYTSALTWCLNHRKATATISIVSVLASAALIPFLGRDFFPLVDAGQFRLHVRAPSGTRIEETERIFTKVENVIREVIPADELVTILDNIGLPTGGVNLAFSDSATIGAADGEILVALNPEKHGPTWDYVRTLRQRPVQERKSIRFVVIGNRVAQRLHGSNHLSLACIAFAGGMAFDGAHGHALVRDLVVLAPGGQRGQQAAVDVRGVHTEMTAHLLKVNGSNAR